MSNTSITLFAFESSAASQAEHGVSEEAVTRGSGDKALQDAVFGVASVANAHLKHVGTATWGTHGCNYIGHVVSFSQNKKLDGRYHILSTIAVVVRRLAVREGERYTTSCPCNTESPLGTSIARYFALVALRGYRLGYLISADL